MNKLIHHDTFLKKNVFFVKDKWPHFNLLFEDISKLRKKYKKNILSLERGGLYGSISIFKPYFNENNFTSIDCSSSNIKKRGAYNRKFVLSHHIIKKKIDYHRNYKNLKLKNNFYNLIIIPNLMHHIYDGKLLLDQCYKALKKNGVIYIFEPLVRELHQMPDDYFRYTPYGLNEILKEIGFKRTSHKLCGGPFSAALYCLDQAMQFLPEKQSVKFKKNIIDKNFNKFLKLENKFRKNKFRKFTTFPMSFSITSRK